MGLETATYLNQLDPTNPLGSDSKAQGDDHLRLIKQVLKNTFPNINAAVTVTPTELNYLAGVTSNVQTQLDAKEVAANKGVANGYCELDASALVPLARLPATLTGKDADTVDGLQGSQLARLDVDNTLLGEQTIQGFTDATANREFLKAVPDDYGVGKPRLTFAKKGAGTYQIALWDTVTNDVGTLRLWAGNVILKGPNVTVDTAAFTATGPSFDVQSTTFTRNGNTVWHAGNDGAGSGLDADTIDGLDSSQLVRTDADSTVTNTILFKGFVHADTYHAAWRVEPDDYGVGKPRISLLKKDPGKYTIALFDSATTRIGTLELLAGTLYLDGDNIQLNATTTTTTGGTFDVQSTTFTRNGNVVWHAGNDGPGSGLDADTIDGLDSSQLARTDASNTLQRPQIIGSFTDTLGATGSVPILQLEPDDYGVGVPRLQLSKKGAGTYFIELWDSFTNDVGTMRLWAGTLELKGPNVNTLGGTFDVQSTNFTRNGNVVWHAGNDGPGSGLDADTVDGLQGSQLARTDVGNILTSLQTITGFSDATTSFVGVTLHPDDFGVGKPRLELTKKGTGTYSILLWDGTTVDVGQLKLQAGTLLLDAPTVNVQGTTFTKDGNTVWHAGNDGPGSGLDADTVDGYQVGSATGQISPRYGGEDTTVVTANTGGAVVTKSFTIPAGALRAGRTCRLCLYGKYNVTSGGPKFSNSTRIDFGATTLVFSTGSFGPTYVYGVTYEWWAIYDIVAFSNDTVGLAGIGYGETGQWDVQPFSLVPSTAATGVDVTANSYTVTYALGLTSGATAWMSVEKLSWSILG